MSEDENKLTAEPTKSASGKPTPAKKASSDFRKMFVKCVAVLCGIAVASGLLLGLFHQLTFISDAERVERVAKKIQDFRPGNYRAAELGDNVRTKYDDGEVSYLFEDLTAGSEAFVVIVTGYKGYGGDIEFYFVLESLVVTDLRVGSNKETPGVSDNALKNQTFLGQFKGKTVKELYRLLVETGSGIDSATGATYSSTGTKNAAKTMAEFMTEFMREG